METRTLADRIDDLSPLADPVRRRLYVLVAESAEPVGRDEAATRAGVSRALAAFHLDRLVEAGLLKAEFRRLSGRTGPGAGRPSKLYARADRQVSVSIPDRRYELLAGMLARAVETAGPAGEAVGDALESGARSLGNGLGSEARRRSGRQPTTERLVSAAVGVLAEAGFEPVRDGDGFTLRNCPFDAVAQDHRELICGMNAALMEGVQAGLGTRRLRTELDPAPGRCCVVWRPTEASTRA